MLVVKPQCLVDGEDTTDWVVFSLENQSCRVPKESWSRPLSHRWEALPKDNPQVPLLERIQCGWGKGRNHRFPCFTKQQNIQGYKGRRVRYGPSSFLWPDAWHASSQDCFPVFCQGRVASHSHPPPTHTDER